MEGEGKLIKDDEKVKIRYANGKLIKKETTETTRF